MSSGTAFVINSAPGGGKSTLLKALHSLLPDGFAVIDGDDVGKVTPYLNNINWLNVMQDNIADCCRNYKAYGFHHCIIGFVFPVQERLDRMVNLLNNRGFGVKHILLSCGDSEISQRIAKRSTGRLINIEQALKLNQQLHLLPSDYKIDTTFLNVEGVTAKVMAYITEAIKNETD